MIEILYNITNGSFLFTIIMVALQMTIPFYISYYTIKAINYLKNNKKLKLNNINIKEPTTELKIKEKAIK